MLTVLLAERETQEILKEKKMVLRVIFKPARTTPLMTLDDEAMHDHDDLNSEQDKAQIADEKPDMFWNYKCSEFLE